MAYLTKEQYNRRRENAAIRNMGNEEIAMENGMTEEQAELISELCSLRHEIHCNEDEVICNDEYGRKDKLLALNEKIHLSGLPCIETIPNTTDDYIDIDSIYDLQDYYDEDVPEQGTKEWQNWYDENYERISGELEKLNKDIEKYLNDIDTKYHTHFCPTGALRVF